MTEQAPRINAQYLEAFTGKTVMITGKVSQIRGESAVIDANGEVTVLLNRVRTSPSHVYLTIHLYKQPKAQS
jgi:DNA/RNA endonuclease YhcR with UshA esterase domain